MEKTKIYSIYTDEASELKEIFLRSIQDDWNINLKNFGQTNGNGNWGTPEFGQLMRKRIYYIISIIKENWYDVIVWADIDIQFFRKCSKLIEQAIDGMDILFQSENWPEKEVNAGFIVIRCNEKTLSFFETVWQKDLEKLEFFDQSAMNEILKENKIGLRWDILPSQFWARSHHDAPPKDIVLHHANCTNPVIRNGKEIGSIELKLEQYKNIRKYVLSNNLK